MKIKKLSINNYRNLAGKTILFDDVCNFIVGENNLGKSNLLNLIQILFTNRAFKFTDFTEVTKPIVVQIQLKLDEIEIGHFEDLFDTANYHLINIIGIQNTVEDNIEFYHEETKTFISSSVIRCINYINYDSLRNPASEINFDKGKGVGKFLTTIVSNYISEKQLTDKDFIKEATLNGLLEDVNKKIVKLKSFRDFKISAWSENDLESLLPRIMVLKDDKGESLTKSGYGVQFLILITLSILERIHAIKQQRQEKGIFEKTDDHKKFISLIIGLDEPEIHLHPYMQRSLVKYLNNIINNKNSDFQLLVKELFDIDGFLGQIVIATHSPNIILNDYNQIIRLYPKAGITHIKSGSEINLNPQYAKQLYMQFPYMKEAFFSRCVIFAEGASEEASFVHFAEKMSIDLDDNGISVIQSRGGKVRTVELLMKLASEFGIPSVGIGDKDNNTPVTSPLYLTDKRDFDEEIVSLFDSGREQILETIVSEFESPEANIQTGSLNFYAVKKYKITNSEFNNDLKLSTIPKTDVVNLKSFYITWFASKKSFTLGKLIGEKLELNDVPSIYKTVINKAIELAR
jgi:putative ATP-dependent endonuclease of OLD family